MKIVLRTTWKKDVQVAISEDNELSTKIDPENAFYFDVDSAIFDRFLSVTKDKSGSWFTPIMDFDKDELSEIKFFNLICRKAVKETSADNEYNHGKVDETPLKITSEKIGIKLVKGISFSNLKTKPNVIAGADWMEEYIIHEFTAGLFRDAALSGFETIPIYNNKRDQFYEEYFQLYTDNIMPLATKNIATIFDKRIVDGVYYWLRNLGCLVYDFKKNHELMDFNRTAENWSSNNMPLWIVSSRVKEIYEMNKLKGWEFNPVLEEFSDIYKSYLDKWVDLFHRVKENPNNKFM